HGSIASADGATSFFSGERTGDVPADEGEDEGDDATEESSEEGEDAEAAEAGEADDAEASEDEDEAETETPDVPEKLTLPFGAFGRTGLPEERTVVFTGATVWTADDAGILEDATVVVADGKLVYVGAVSGAPAPEGAETIDATGLHITPGLIDCHSHTGISGGVNEVGRRVTAEVRVADVIDPDDISFHNQLAGGLVAANQLHGSANAIGGQNSVVKLRWGAAHPDDMRVAGAKPGIKFALGENPKRVASGSDDPTEYPQSRLGVEALIHDRLLAGRDYAARMARYESLNGTARAAEAPPRRDLELEAMAEIVTGGRLIHCHSYRQDEILMLARLAQAFGFKIGTFQHVLEGYKVANAVRDSALGASTFSDWWAYKFEVVDAIPHNAALMTRVGVNVSINSDSDEHARRLNTEAAKAIKYGGLEPNEALKLVTLNPAIQLGVGDRMGSLVAGKDADLALWNGDPLSYRSRCVGTWIDGREYWSEAIEAALSAQADAERQRIVQKLLAMDVKPKKKGDEAGDGGDDDRGRRSAEFWAMQAEMEELWRSGNDPALARP
ncbi:MAG: amidohydrolase family protein, partial [Planctomycetota bacterium]